jgi:hypothetical protein
MWRRDFAASIRRTLRVCALILLTVTNVFGVPGQSRNVSAVSDMAWPSVSQESGVSVPDLPVARRCLDETPIAAHSGTVMTTRARLKIFFDLRCRSQQSGSHPVLDLQARRVFRYGRVDPKP